MKYRLFFCASVFLLKVFFNTDQVLVVIFVCYHLIFMSFSFDFHFFANCMSEFVEVLSLVESLHQLLAQRNNPSIFSSISIQLRGIFSH